MNGISVIDTDYTHYDKAVDRHIVVAKRHQYHSIAKKHMHSVR